MKPDVVAPGYQIASCSNLADTAYNTYSGTSQASPQVAGACALLIDFCKTEGLAYTPGVIKGALMKTAELLTPTTTFTLLQQGRGLINVGAAATLLASADTEGSNPIIGAVNPVQNPVHIYAELLQGQTVEQFLTCVSPFRDDNLNLTVTGDAADLLTLGNVTNYYSATTQVLYSVPVDTEPGTYSGEFTFTYKTHELDTVDIDIKVLPSHGEHRMLLNFRTTDSVSYTHLTLPTN